MTGSNISRDHIAMEAMKVIMSHYVAEQMTIKNRIKRFLGLEHEAFTRINPEWLAKMSYMIADAMIAQREKTLEDKL